MNHLEEQKRQNTKKITLRRKTSLFCMSYKVPFLSLLLVTLTDTKKIVRTKKERDLQNSLDVSFMNKMSEHEDATSIIL